MRIVVLYGSFLLFSCGQEPKEMAVPDIAPDTSIIVATPNTSIDSADTDFNFAKEDTPAEKPPPPVPIKRPSGIYRFLQSAESGKKIIHTISFAPGTFRLQEEYGYKRDSIVMTEGTWAPSAGYIWLYKDQVVRGRYTRQGDTLQYYSPRMKETFPMQKLQPVTSNDFWQQKKKEGAVLYAIGNEPFWSAEITKQDTLVVNMPDWNTPLRVKVNAGNATPDSTTYTTTNDSIQVVVYPMFCSDGMSDFLYTEKVKMRYKGQTYSGCGERFLSSF